MDADIIPSRRMQATGSVGFDDVARGWVPRPRRELCYIRCVLGFLHTFVISSPTRFLKIGFEYWADPSSPDDGFITWMTEDTARFRMGASAMGPDTGTNGTGVGQRLVPEEPMAIILNLGISRA